MFVQSHPTRGGWIEIRLALWALGLDSSHPTRGGWIEIYARGGNRGGGNYSREGGYSRDDAKSYMMDQIEEMMEMAEKPAEKEALKRCMQALERA